MATTAPYMQIADDLRSKLAAGRWRPGDRLPTLDQLADEYQRSRNTVRAAVDQLRGEGRITRRGMYVPEHEPARSES